MKTLYLMQGIPGSGKSTVAEMLADQVKAVIHSTDSLWYDEEGVYNYDASLANAKHRENQRNVVASMHTGVDIVVDNTNITNVAIAPYLMMSYIFGYQVQVIRVTCAVEVAIRRQESRPEDRRVPDDVITKMAGQMQDLNLESIPTVSIKNFVHGS